MRHAWMLDVLADLKCYAQANGFPALAVKVGEALALARIEAGHGRASDGASEGAPDGASDGGPDTAKGAEPGPRPPGERPN